MPADGACGLESGSPAPMLKAGHKPELLSSSGYGGRDRQILGACWSAWLVKMVSFRFSERLLQENKVTKWGGQSLADTHAHTLTCIGTCTHPYTLSVNE